MDKEAKENLIRAGRLAAEARDESHKIVREGREIKEIAEEIEQLIHDKGGKPAFPVNVSVNEKAAHDTASGNDERVIGRDVVKVDVGVHIDGYIGDTATTICLNPEYNKMKESVEKALKVAVKLATPGVKISDISAAIEDSITKDGFVPISNLTGHGIGRYEQHAFPTIPNVKFESGEALSKGQVIAIEPFATNGEGFVKEGETVIYGFENPTSLRNEDARKIASYAAELGTPFCERWIIRDSEKIGCSKHLYRIRLALREMAQRGTIHEYPVLKDKGVVAQAEHTLIVDDKPIITTDVSRNKN